MTAKVHSGNTRPVSRYANLSSVRADGSRRRSPAVRPATRPAATACSQRSRNRYRTVTTAAVWNTPPEMIAAETWIHSQYECRAGTSCAESTYSTDTARPRVSRTEKRTGTPGQRTGFRAASKPTYAADAIRAKAVENSHMFAPRRAAHRETAGEDRAGVEQERQHGQRDCDPSHQVGPGAVTGRARAVARRGSVFFVRRGRGRCQHLRAASCCTVHGHAPRPAACECGRGPLCRRGDSGSTNYLSTAQERPASSTAGEGGEPQPFLVSWTGSRKNPEKPMPVAGVVRIDHTYREPVAVLRAGARQVRWRRPCPEERAAVTAHSSNGASMLCPGQRTKTVARVASWKSARRDSTVRQPTPDHRAPSGARATAGSLGPRNSGPARRPRPRPPCSLRTVRGWRRGTKLRRGSRPP